MVRFDFVLLSPGRMCPRPTFRGDLHPDTAAALPPRTTGFGWSVPHEVDHRMAPPESALRLMEAGAGLPDQAERLKTLAAEFRAAIAAGHRQADDASSEQQVVDFIGTFLAQAYEGD